MGWLWRKEEEFPPHVQHSVAGTMLYILSCMPEDPEAQRELILSQQTDKSNTWSVQSAKIMEMMHPNIAGFCDEVKCTVSLSHDMNDLPDRVLLPKSHKPIQIELVFSDLYAGHKDIEHRPAPFDKKFEALVKKIAGKSGLTSTKDMYHPQGEINTYLYSSFGQHYVRFSIHPADYGAFRDALVEFYHETGAAAEQAASKDPTEQLLRRLNIEPHVPAHKPRGR